jgi:CBS domain containing-hemolysin-like protein
MIDLQPFLVLLICLIGSFLFSGSESGFVSWNIIKVRHKAEAGDLFAKWALYLMNYKDRLLSTVLIANNICNIGATLSFLIVYEMIDQLVFLDLARVPSPESWFLTPFLVLFGEMLPKSLFRIYSLRLTLKAIPLLLTCYFLTLPLTWLFSKILNFFRKEPLGFEESFKAKVREEMVLVALEGSKRGTLIESADILINNVLKLKDKTIKDLMIGISEYKKNNHVFRSNQTINSIINKIPDSNEILVFDEQVSKPIGIVSVLDIAAQNYGSKLSEFIKPVKEIEMQQSLLSVLQDIEPDTTEHYLVVDNKSAVGIVQKSSFYRQVFSNTDAT